MSYIYIHMFHTDFIILPKVFRALRFSVILKCRFDPSSRINRCTYSSNAFCIFYVCLSLAHLLSNYSDISTASYHMCTWPEHNSVTVCTRPVLCVHYQTSITLLPGTTAQLMWHNPNN